MLYLSYKGKKIYAQYIQPQGKTADTCIVFLHEALGSVSQWRDFPQRLSDETSLNVLVYDRLGHGLSDPLAEKRGIDYLHKEAWEVLPVVLEQLEIKNPVLFGHSDGASIALLYAARFATQALILEAAHVCNDAYTVSGIQAVLPQKNLWVERLSRHHGEKSNDLYDAWSETWRSAFFKDWNITDLLPSIPCPVFAVQGENDEYGAEAQINLIKQGVKGARTTLIIPDCGHTPHREVADFMLDKTRLFIAAARASSDETQTSGARHIQSDRKK